jgi:3-phosphoshikimate 1-carboxyvinyltransferase
VPGDKSIAHRALMLAGLARGTSVIHNLPSGEDVLSTASCMSRLGATIEVEQGVARLSSEGRVLAPTQALDVGNSGTTIRLLTGMLAGQTFSCRLTGDGSLRRRPMGRVVDPLRQMGASIATHDGSAPLDITGSSLRGITYTLPVASAQVKSAVLLAGLFASGSTKVIEIVPARDHTERMLHALGLNIQRHGTSVEVERGSAPSGFTLTVPGDISSAAFLLSAAALTDGEVTIDSVGLNPTRTAILTVLRRMGATVNAGTQFEEGGEPRGTATVSGRVERPIHICAEDVPGLVDELTLVALLATQVEGESVIEGATELRVKETDRIAAVAHELALLGADIEERPDGWLIRGKTPLYGGTVQSHGDHRLAMMLAVAGACARGETVIERVEAADVSFPGFVSVFASLGAVIEAD